MVILLVVVIVVMVCVYKRFIRKQYFRKEELVGRSSIRGPPNTDNIKLSDPLFSSNTISV